MRTLGLGGFLTFGFLAGLVFFFFGCSEMSIVHWKVWLAPRSIPATRTSFAPFLGFLPSCRLYFPMLPAFRAVGMDRTPGTPDWLWTTAPAAGVLDVHLPHPGVVPAFSLPQEVSRYSIRGILVCRLALYDSLTH